MSLPRSTYDPRRVCLLPFPTLALAQHKRPIGVYTAGALFALGNWLFFDAAVLSAHAKPPPDAPYDTVPVHVAFVDWLPGILSIFGLLIVNLIDKERLIGDGGAFGDGGLVWRARLFLFMGFALMAGGLAGSVTVLVLKYIVPAYPDSYTYYGYANVGQNVALMLSAMVLWLAQNTPSEYEYRLSLFICQWIHYLDLYSILSVALPYDCERSLLLELRTTTNTMPGAPNPDRPRFTQK